MAIYNKHIIYRSVLGVLIVAIVLLCFTYVMESMSYADQSGEIIDCVNKIKNMLLVLHEKHSVETIVDNEKTDVYKKIYDLGASVPCSCDCFGLSPKSAFNNIPFLINPQLFTENSPIKDKSRRIVACSSELCEAYPRLRVGYLSLLMRSVTLSERGSYVVIGFGDGSASAYKIEIDDFDKFQKWAAEFNASTPGSDKLQAFMK
jgi:hypothetical protein